MDSKCVCPTGTAAQRTCSGGKKTRNPYLNFLRQFRSQHCAMAAVEIVRQGAAQWRQMTPEARAPYVTMARSTSYVFFPRRFFGRAARRSSVQNQSCPVGCRPASASRQARRASR
ncbi:protamine-like [Sabethes cyaneus]|uniref:protamine-like n=1 Tax=Sabethes cyaneus TaxID=53552 RepID=UPI00237DB75C|nr:protamine-like [Sabethes cyaneus]